jgi:hypothetical protein
LKQKCKAHKCKSASRLPFSAKDDKHCIAPVLFLASRLT